MDKFSIKSLTVILAGALTGLGVSAAHAETAPAVFARCAVCHNAEKGAPTKVGPNLYGVFGHKAAKSKFTYSDGLKKSGFVWNEATLDKWIAGPMQLVPGTYMSFPGIKDAAKRAEIIAYLKSLH